jgi:hypothetical protein
VTDGGRMSPQRCRGVGAARAAGGTAGPTMEANGIGGTTGPGRPLRWGELLHSNGSKGVRLFGFLSGRSKAGSEARKNLFFARLI